MSFMIDDISRPVEWASKNCAPCLSTLSKTVLRRSVTAENADVVDQVVRQIVAQALDQKDRDDGERHHGPDGRCESIAGTI